MGINTASGTSTEESVTKLHGSRIQLYFPTVYYQITNKREPNHNNKPDFQSGFAPAEPTGFSWEQQTLWVFEDQILRIKKIMQSVLKAHFTSIGCI